MSDCLSREDFRRFNERRLDPAALISFHDHLYTCADCRTAYESFAQEEGSEPLDAPTETQWTGAAPRHHDASPNITESIAATKTENRSRQRWPPPASPSGADFTARGYPNKGETYVAGAGAQPRSLLLGRRADVRR